jgi:hypothetical protein
MSKGPKIPNPADAAVAGIQADTSLQPFKYLIDSASTLGHPITIDGKTYDFSGLGQAATTSKISDQMAQTLLDLQTEKSPAIIAQRLAELKAADPQGYAARQQLFDRIISDAQQSPNRPVSSDLQQTLQDELAKGAGFSDAKQSEQVREGVRGQQSKSGIYLGNSPTSQEAKTMVNAGESLQNQRQQDALNLLQSGSSPEDVAYRELQQNLANLGAFQTGETPQAQFRQVSSAANGPVPLVGGASPTNTFNPNAAGQGVNNAFSNWNTQFNYQNSQANPWLAGLSLAANTTGTLANINPGWFSGGSSSSGSPAPWTAPGQSPQEITNSWLGG